MRQICFFWSVFVVSDFSTVTPCHTQPRCVEADPFWYPRRRSCRYWGGCWTSQWPNWKAQSQHAMTVTGALSTSPFHADQCPESDPASSNVGLAWGDDGRWPGFADFHVQLIAMLGSVSSRDGARQSVDFHFQGIVRLRGKFYTTKRFMMISRGCLIWMDRIGSSHGCVCKRAPYPSVMVI